MTRLLRSLSALVLGLALSFPAFAVDRTIRFDNATATLTDAPCVLTEEKPDPKSDLKGGTVKFDGTGDVQKLCWVEEDGLIWILTERLQILSVDAKRAKPVGVSI